MNGFVAKSMKLSPILGRHRPHAMSSSDCGHITPSV